MSNNPESVKSIKFKIYCLLFGLLILMGIFVTGILIYRANQNIGLVKSAESLSK